MKAKEPNQIRILVVDDEQDFRNVLAYLLKRRGYQVLTAANGKEAFELLEKTDTSVDAVISDIRMPQGDGIELLDRVREKNIEAPCILLVSGFTDLTAEEAYNKGAEAMFSKPFDHKVLEETIKRVLTPAPLRWEQETENADSGLTVEIHVPGISEALNTKKVTIGRGGMFVSFTSGRPLNTNDNVIFKFSSRSQESSISGKGIVRWIRLQDRSEFPAGCGIEFTYLGDSERKFVMEHLKEKKTKAYIPNQ